MLTTEGGEPQSRAQALKDPAWDIVGGWREAEEEELTSLEKMGVLEWICECDVPADAKVLNTKMVYKDKRPMSGMPGRRKCRCVVRGFMESAADYGDGDGRQAARHTRHPRTGGESRGEHR